MKTSILPSGPAFLTDFPASSRGYVLVPFAAETGGIS